MHRRAVEWFTLCLSIFAVGACDATDDPGAVDDPDLGDVSARGEIDNGQVLNSAVLNGLQFNGLQLNGLQFNGLQFNGLQFNGLQFNGSAFTGTIDLGDGPVLKSGVDFIGAELKLSAGQQQFTLRFDDIAKNPAQPGADVYFHTISVRDDAVGTWSSLCRDPNGTPTEAILMANYWDMQTGARHDDAAVITFACRHAVLAKCVEWGYVPWRTATACEGKTCSVVSLRDHHQACTRMARADYCGDGRSYTFNGTPIDLFDKLSPVIQARATRAIPSWRVEAEWGPDGATCVGDELRMTMYDERQIAYVFPTCIAARHDPHCGDFKKERASKLADAYCGEWETNPAACSGINDDRPPKPPKP